MKKIAISLLLLSCSLCGHPQTPDADGILYVKEKATGTGDSWTDASGSFADALKAAQTNTTIKQIWVAAGTYQPASKQSFSMVHGVSIYGHFAGTETSSTERNLGSNDISYLKGNGSRVITNDNNGLTPSDTLDGFYITGGNVTSGGGGIYNYRSNPSLTNVTISGNSVTMGDNGSNGNHGEAGGNGGSGLGGGIFNNSSSPVLTNVIISGNIATGGSGGNGGNGGEHGVGTSPTVRSGNGGTGGIGGGGGMFNNSSAPILTNVIISGNTVNGGQGGNGGYDNGGGSYYQGGNGGDGGKGFGGGVYNDNSSPVLTNVTISGNTTTGGTGGTGGGSSGGGTTGSTGTDGTVDGAGVYNHSSSPKIRNSIILGNSASTTSSIYNDNNSSPSVRFTLVEGSAGTADNNIDATNITAATVFQTPIDLTGSLPTTTGDFRLNATGTNPVLSKGSKDFYNSGETPDLSSITTDLEGKSRFDSLDKTLIDLGAYQHSNQLEVKGNGIVIMRADATPSASDHTDFGIQAVPSNTIRTFTIQNKRTVALTISSVMLSGIAAADYSITTQPDATVAAWDSTTFQVTFAPSALGNREALITVNSDDADAATYDFAISGTGIGPDGILYVKQNGTGEGYNWANAMGSFADALNAAQTNPGVKQIWVANGTWYPRYNKSGDGSIPADPREASFLIKRDGLKIVGGFAGTETDITQRNIAANLTILSGDIGKENNNSDNSYHVLVTDGTAAAITSTLLVDGFTITGGETDADNGGGVLNISSSPVLSNLNISANRAKEGGGMYNLNSSPALTNVTVRGNNAVVYNGGGIYNNNSSPILTNVIISGNQAKYNGGGIYNYSSSSPVLTNVIIGSNRAKVKGGGIYNWDNSNPKIRNSIILGNSAPTSNGIYNDHTAPAISFSLVQENTSTADNNIDATNKTKEMVFISPADAASAPTINGDYHLKSDANNPVLSKGNKDFYNTGETPDLSFITTDLDGRSRFDSLDKTLIDLGAYQHKYQVNVLGNGIGIARGDATPSATDHTDFGAQAAASGKTTRTFTIQNNRAISLTISSITVTGTAATDYSITNQPATITLATLDSVTFQVTFTPSVTGSRDATIIVNSDDANDATYDFAITGTGVAPDADGILYVKQNAMGAGDSWASAMGNFADALNAAQTGVTIKQIWVANGTWYPKYTNNGDGSTPANLRDASFHIKRGDLKIVGGFAGTETNLAQRNTTANPTVLSGDIGMANDNTDNSYHVVVIDSVASTITGTLLDGFTITGGNANNGKGGGIYNNHSSPVLTNIIISGNKADNGGGMYIEDNSSPVLTNVIISGNSANYNGGGIYNYNSSKPVLTNVTIGSNKAEDNGGGMYNWDNSNPKIRNSIILGNSAATGNGIYNESPSSSYKVSSPAISYSLVEGSTGTADNIDATGITTADIFKTPIDINGSFPTTAGDFRLIATSNNPVLGKGSKDFYITGETPDLSSITTDLGGKPRFDIIDKTIDLGAYQHANEVDLFGNGIGILRDDATPSVSDNTDFGVQAVDSNTIRSFNIQNNRTISLTISSVTLSGVAATDYSITTQPATTVAAGDSTTFQVSFTPSALGTRSATITIHFNDAYEADFDFAITGKGIGPDANGILYVKQNATGTGDSWANAMGSFADALNVAQTGTAIKQVWVAKGIWYPKYSKTGDGSVPTNLREASFQIKRDGLKIYGGFAGTETDIAQRNIAASSTVLSGDTGIPNDSTDNNYHVLVIDGTATPITSTLIDGFTITAGHANGDKFPDNIGGGVLIDSASPILTNIIISRNTGIGGGIANYNKSSPVLTNVTISGNTGIIGSGMANVSNSNPILTNVVISGNEANTDPNNSYTGIGSGMLNLTNCSPVLTNVTITGNKADLLGGGMANYDNCNPKIHNSIILGNSAATGNGIYNENSSTYYKVSSPAISYSLVEDSTSTAGNNIDATNITAEDIFKTPIDMAGSFPTTAGDFRLNTTGNNPAQDKGNNDFFKSGETPDLSSITTDLDKNARFDGVIDLGAYELQTHALPVRLLSFTGEVYAQSNLLHWQTADETGFSGFEIERAFAQSRFSSIGFITAGGNSYQFTDNNVQPGIYYYRLKLLDIDGQFNYSKTIVLKRSATDDVQVYPVPVTNELHLVNAKGDLELYNNNGQLLVHQSITGNGPTVINVQQFAAGIYILRLRRTGGELVVKKIVKQ